jgi:hypothetical protein
MEGCASGALSLLDGSRLVGMAKLGSSSAKLSVHAALIPAVRRASAGTAGTRARLELTLWSTSVAILAAAHECLVWRLNEMSMQEVCTRPFSTTSYSTRPMILSGECVI